MAADEVAQLNRIRLDEDLTYEELAVQIRAAVRSSGAAGDIDATVVHRALNKPDRKPLDRTLHKFRAFLEAREAKKKKRAARRRPS